MDELKTKADENFKNWSVDGNDIMVCTTMAGVLEPQTTYQVHLSILGRSAL
ncbi:hypothetical protein APSETT444_006642 [Aspergillus pseudonomiae]